MVVGGFQRADNSLKILLYKVHPDLKNYNYSIVSYNQYLEKSSRSELNITGNSTNDQTLNTIL